MQYQYNGMRLLIIEDEPDILQSLKKSLKSEGFTVDGAADGIKGFNLARINNYNAIIMDLDLPGKSGDEICRDLRSAGKTTPIIILTVNGNIDSKVSLLEYGADDYLTKPFSFKELLARIKALGRRPKEITENILKIGGLVLDQNRQTVSRNGKEIRLTTKEFEILKYLMLNRGEIVSHNTLLGELWGEEANIFSNSIETHISNIREKITFGKNPDLIKTISGRGYKIE